MTDKYKILKRKAQKIRAKCGKIKNVKIKL